MSRIVVAGTEGPLGQAVAARYAELGHDVVWLQLANPGDLGAALGEIGSQPIDLLIAADDYHASGKPAEAVTRDDLREGLMRLAFLPFHVATLLKPQLVATGGKIVLLTRSDATMTAQDRSGRYLERPFRAAAHQLWRSLAAEWPKDSITCLLVAVDSLDTAGLPAVIAGAKNGTLTDAAGRELGW